MKKTIINEKEYEIIKDYKNGFEKEELENKLNSNREDAVKAVNLYYHNINASNFTFIFSSFRANSDFFILPIDYVNKQKDTVIKYSDHIDTYYVNSIFNEELSFSYIVSLIEVG